MRIVSGMRPTGPLHLGHYIGVLTNWLELQKSGDCFFFVADWHALTTAYEDTSQLRQHTRDTVVDWLSVGVDPTRATIFVQSAVPEVAELHLLLSMVTPLNWLERNTTVKDQVRELHLEEKLSYGHLGYPVLQTADVLAVNGEQVPVGQDQLPHLEISRDIVRRFNHYFGEVFKEPKPKLTRFPVLLGIDGRKMSKSYGNAISLRDDAQTLKAKIKEMVTDPARIRKTDPGHPEVCSVFAYYGTFAPELQEQAASECRGALIGCVQCKFRLADHLSQGLEPIHARREALEREPGKLEAIIEEGNAKARLEAQKTLREVKRAMQLNP